ncbi:MAG: type II toxin-antitoxin system HicB family antitoxin [Solirubrobacterales bacterium]
MRDPRPVMVGDMTTTTFSNTVYTHSVAKVMISIPDDLLARLDSLAQAKQETRSGFLRRLAERELQSDSEHQRKEVERLLDLATAPMGGEAAKLIREDRESH